MFLTTVIPIARAISKEELAYLSMDNFPIGSLIHIPLRNKMVTGLVIECIDAKKKKMSIRSSSFILKKVPGSIVKKRIPRKAIEIVKRTSDYFATSFGAAFFSLNHRYLLDAVGEIDEKKRSTKKSYKRSVRYLEGSYDFRINDYEEIIRLNSSRSMSTAIIFPTIDSLRRTYDLAIKNDFKKKSILFHGKISKKKFKENIKRLDGEKDLVILATPPFLFALPQSTKTIIIEEEASRHYKMRNRPFIDYRYPIRDLSERCNIDLLEGDVLLDSSLFIIDGGDDCKNHIQDKDRLRVRFIDRNKKKDDSNKNFSAIDNEMSKEIEASLKDGGKVFIFAPRKGYAPIVLCEHCGAIVKCNQCDAPVVLHLGKKEGDNYFLCHHCGERRSALEKCKVCQSWKLRAYGIGIEKIVEEINKKFKKDLEEQNIVIGTERSLDLMSDAFDLSIIPSLDSLLSIPDFNIDEQIFRKCLLMIERTARLLVVGTKHMDQEIIKNIEEQDISSFHRSERVKRKSFRYPPFSTFMKISVSGKKSYVSNEIDRLKKELQKWSPNVFPAFIKTIKNNVTMHMLLKLDNSYWPDSELLAYLKSLSPSIEVNVNPQSLL